MISLAPGCISRRFLSATGLDTASHTVTPSRRRSSKEYSEGSVLSRYSDEGINSPPYCGYGCGLYLQPTCLLNRALHVLEVDRIGLPHQFHKRARRSWQMSISPVD